MNSDTVPRMTFGGGAFSCIGFKFSQLETSELAPFIVRFQPLTTPSEVVLALLLERYVFALPSKEIKWNMGGIQVCHAEEWRHPHTHAFLKFPSVPGVAGAHMPLRMSLVKKEST
jgi:hypothetical protein